LFASRLSESDARCPASRGCAMTVEFSHTGREYDESFKRALIREILDAITEVSILPGTNTVMLRAGETCEALVSCLAAFAAMSPCFDVPETLHEFTQGAAIRLKRAIAKARADGGWDKFVLGAQLQRGHA